MYYIELHNGISKIMEVYYRLGFWHQGDETSVKQTKIKIVYSILYFLYPLSLLAGALKSDSKDESMFLGEVSVLSSVFLVRLFYIMWKQSEIFELLHLIGVYSFKDKVDFAVVDKKLKSFMKWITYFYLCGVVTGLCATIGVPFIESEKKVFFNVGFPLDYKNNEIGFWMVFLFEITETFMSVLITSYPIIIWYLMLNCALKYDVLGSELENMGKIDAAVTKQKISVVEKQRLFNRNLIAGIESYKDINKSTQQLESFFAKQFSIQLTTSAFFICTSVYSLTFNNSENIIELLIYAFNLLYNIFDIFMVMYFGNEIKLSSDRLSYCLFKSDWIEQPESCKKVIIIFGERLKQSQQLVILKLYPLNLETFTRILNGAYSMFNILKTLAK